MSDHGTRYRYVHFRCRCEACTRANREYTNASRTRRRANLLRAPHGTASGYVNWGCRCDDCKIAGAQSNKGMAVRTGRLKGVQRPSPVPHGTVGGYSNRGCRCDKCRAANSAYKAEWYQRRKDRTVNVLSTGGEDQG